MKWVRTVSARILHGWRDKLIPGLRVGIHKRWSSNKDGTPHYNDINARFMLLSEEDENSIAVANVPGNNSAQRKWEIIVGLAEKIDSPSTIFNIYLSMVWSNNSSHSVCYSLFVGNKLGKWNDGSTSGKLEPLSVTCGLFHVTTQDSRVVSVPAYWLEKRKEEK